MDCLGFKCQASAASKGYLYLPLRAAPTPSPQPFLTCTVILTHNTTILPSLLNAKFLFYTLLHSHHLDINIKKNPKKGLLQTVVREPHTLQSIQHHTPALLPVHILQAKLVYLCLCFIMSTQSKTVSIFTCFILFLKKKALFSKMKNLDYLPINALIYKNEVK